MSKLKNRLPFVIYLLIIIVILGFLSLLVGSTKISASKVFTAVFIPSTSNASSIIWQIRMPRLLLEILSGTLLAMAGSILLGIFGTAVIDNLLAKAFYLLAAAVAAVSVFLLVFGVNLNPLYPWLLGSLGGTAWDKVLILALFIIIGLVIYVFYYKDLNALLFGEYTAKTLGVEVRRVRMFLFAVAAAISEIGRAHV